MKFIVEAEVLLKQTAEKEQLLALQNVQKFMEEFIMLLGKDFLQKEKKLKRKKI